jgi:hypothetical protein
MPEVGALDAGQAASLASLAPVARQSGHWRSLLAGPPNQSGALLPLA